MRLTKKTKETKNGRCRVEEPTTERSKPPVLCYALTESPVS